MVKTLRISDENHKEMLKIQGQIQAKSGEFTAMDDVIAELVKNFHTQAKAVVSSFLDRVMRVQLKLDSLGQPLAELEAKGEVVETAPASILAAGEFQGQAPPMVIPEGFIPQDQTSHVGGEAVEFGPEITQARRGEKNSQSA